MGTSRIRLMKTVILATLGALSVVFAAPASADPDIDFATELHSYGIYGPRDYNAWIGKLTCKRISTGLDSDAYKSANYLKTNLPKDTNEQQVYDFLGAAIRIYCPENQFQIDRLAGRPVPPPVPAGGPLPAEQG